MVALTFNTENISDVIFNLSILSSTILATSKPTAAISPVTAGLIPENIDFMVGASLNFRK